MDEKGFLLGLGSRTKIIYHKDQGKKVLLQGMNLGYFLYMR
jgi:hypothetical protein